MLDTLSNFGLNTALNTGVAGSYMLGSAIDLSLARDVGAGKPLYMVISVSVACLSATGTLQFALVTDSEDPALTSAERLLLTPEFVQADLTAGTLVFVTALPSGHPAYERYIQLMQITGTAAWTAGNINAYLTDAVPNWVSYADGQN
jgi:hypothetical protein